MFNEWYAKDTSRKVKAAIHARHASGEHTCAYAPLGYKKDPENRNHLIIDEETSWIIKKIFNLASHGVGSSRIARVLIEEHIPTAGYFNYRRYGSFANIYAGQPEEKAWAWSIAQIRNILKDETYIGNSVHNKQAHISYKNKKLIRTPSEEWFRVENTHEAIIDKDEFYQVQQQIANRRRQMKTATTQIFSGLMKCADCGLSMSYGRNNITKNPFSYFTCTRYRQISSVNKCTAHYIRYDKLYETVLARLRYWMKFATENREQLISQLTAKLSIGAQSATTDLKTQLSQAEKRKSDVDRMFFKVYEDWSSGRISEYNYTMLSEKYQVEQETLDEKIKRLSEQLDSEKQSENGAEKWVDLLVRYEMPSELNAEMLNALIEKIIIHESVKSDKGKTQEIEIIYRFVGKID